MKKAKNMAGVLVPVFLAVLTLVVMLIYYYDVRQRSEANVLETLQSSVDKQAASLAMTLEGQYALMETGANALAILSGGDVKSVAEELNRVFRPNPYYDFALADAKGAACHADGSLYSIDDREYFQESMQGKRAIMLVKKGKVSGDPRVILSVPVELDGLTIGVLYCGIRLDFFQYGLESKDFGSLSYSFVSDAEGDIIVGGREMPDSDAVNNLDKLAQSQFLRGSYAQVLDDLHTGTAGYAVYIGDGITRYSVYRPLGINQWMLYSVIPGSILEDTAGKNAQNGLFLTGVVMLFAILLNVLVLRQAKISKKQYKYADHLYNTIPCGVIQYSNDEEPVILDCNITCAKVLGYGGKKIPQIGQSFRGIATPETAAILAGKFKECVLRGSSLNYILPVMRSDGNIIYTDRTMELIDTPDGGKIYQEVFIDCTKRELEKIHLEEQYQHELSRHASKQKGLLFTTCLNLTKDKVVSSDLLDPALIRGKTVDELFEAAVEHLYYIESEEWMRDYRSRISRRTLLEDYEMGQMEFRIKHRHDMNGRLIWTATEYNLRINPATGDVMAFLYTWDINDVEVRHLVTGGIANRDYEYFLRIDGNSGTYKRYDLSSRNEENYKKEGDYAVVCGQETLQTVMPPERAAALSKELSLEQVYAQLDKTDRYTVYASMQDKEGHRIDKAMSFFYTDEKNKLLAMTVSDVTEVRRAEVERAEQLRDALNAAEVASSAKGAFLSQMSHEIRTPLNAVIGYLSLAKESEGDEGAVMECVEKSRIASRHLLSIINDVLDISSIESGKLKIAHEEFDLKNLINSVTTVFYSQAREKNIEFEVTLEEISCEWLVGDALRVNQIIMNLLSNAMKFTPAHGRVMLHVTQLGIVKDKVQLSIVVADTGCGMPKEFMDRIFNPFEQQSASTARKHGGSGLGLSITKNLVTMMGGQLRVESTEGQGTVFTVTLAFDMGESREKQENAYDFSGLRALVADDLENDRAYIQNLLKRCSVKCDTVTDGEKAVRQVERRLDSSHPYDLCVIDWNMPGLDGIETTRRIRQIAGDRLPLICVTAYDTTAIVNDAKSAGANSVISKPLFQSTMFDLLVNTFGGYKPREEEGVPDFEGLRGMRLLLAEDNEMNMDIAMRYLTKAGIEVVKSSNGREALERYINAPAQSFDAILMDVQMPEMDGYTASREIRVSTKEDARLIPIIAMTANAFAEDVTAALAAGMNDHIAKPINFNKLFSALGKYARGRMEERIEREAGTEEKV